jgi:hypothetical protein
MLRPSHFRTPRTIHEACFLDCSYIYRTPGERRIAKATDIAFAAALGIAGASLLFYWLSR